MSPVARTLTALIGWYRRRISPLTPRHCRFEPTCSTYALEAVRAHGAAKGTLLALARVLRCHPFSRGGLDPVPVARKAS